MAQPPLQSLPWDAPDLLSGQRSQLVVAPNASGEGGRTLELDRATLFVGRDPQSQLVLDDPSVAQEHFRIQREGDGWLLLDLGSAAGTFVDGVRVARAWLKPGAQIRAGDVALRFSSQKERLRVQPSEAHKFGALVGDSVVMREVFTLLGRIAPAEATLLVVGETGTGKGALARSVHERSKRAGAPFMLVDCGAISESLIESELFGHERGAFTGADKQRIGLLEAASGGTLFLDEIDDLPLELQPKLLRALEERVFQRVGSTTPVKFDSRIIASSKKDLWTQVQHGRFREDLFFRLSVFTVHLPPLRERREDIPALAAALVGESVWSALPKELREQFLSHAWPGNVRELRNALERAGHLAQMPGGVPVDAVLPQQPRGGTPPPFAGGPGAGANGGYTAALQGALSARPQNGYPPPPGSWPASAQAGYAPSQGAYAQALSPELAAAQVTELPAPLTPLDAHGTLPVDYSLDFKKSKDQLLTGFEREYLSRLLRRTDGNVAAAARIAGIDRKHFTLLLRKHALVRRH